MDSTTSMSSPLWVGVGTVESLALRRQAPQTVLFGIPSKPAVKPTVHFAQAEQVPELQEVHQIAYPGSPSATWKAHVDIANQHCAYHPQTQCECPCSPPVNPTFVPSHRRSILGAYLFGHLRRKSFPAIELRGLGCLRDIERVGCIPPPIP